MPGREAQEGYFYLVTVLKNATGEDSHVLGESQFTMKHTDFLTGVKMHISSLCKFHFKSVIGLNTAEI